MLWWLHVKKELMSLIFSSCLSHTCKSPAPPGFCNRIVLNTPSSCQCEAQTVKLICSPICFQIADADLVLWSKCVAQCLSDYASPECSKPDHRKLQWIVSRRTAQSLHSYRSVPELPTIPEGCWDESERWGPQTHPSNTAVTPPKTQPILNFLVLVTCFKL